MDARSRVGSLMAMVAITVAGGLSVNAFAQVATPAATPRAALPLEIPLSDVSGAEVGTASFTEADDGSVTVLASVEGLPPGEHGIHIHETGMCDPSGLEPFSSAGGHYNPTGDSHGAPDDPMAHAGDLGNITITDDGMGSFEITSNRFTLSEGPTSLFDEDGSSLLIHEMADDLQSDPSGMSGAWLACGLVAEPTPVAGTPAAESVDGYILNPEQMPFSEEFLAELQAPEELNNIVEGGNYGWPFCFGDREVDPYLSLTPAGSTTEQFCALTEAPALNYQAHSAPTGMVYYMGDQFPANYQSDAFVAMRGSWNREPVTGYKIVHVQFEDGQPVAIEDFITGWLQDDGASHFGRVAGLAILPDSSMLIAEDTNGVIYRVAYTGDE